MGQERRSWLERFETMYPLVISGMLSAGNVIMTLTQTVIISFGLLFILGALVLVEQRGVQDGILFFFNDMALASFAAAAAVGLNVVVEFYVVHIEHREKFKRPAGIQWSLRLMQQNLAYRRGATRDWKPRRQSPAQRFLKLRTMIAIAIFGLALTGRMTTAIDAASIDTAGKPVTAGEGIHNLLYKSTLADLTKWVMGTMFTMLAVISVQSLTHYMALRVSEIQDDLKRRMANLKAAATRQRAREARLSAPVSVQVSTQTDTRQTGSGYVRVSSAVEKARQYLADNPDKADMPVRELADIIGVGKDSVAKARKELKGG